MQYLVCPVLFVILFLSYSLYYFSRLLNVPVVFRLDTAGDGNNNQKCLKLFGHPNVLKLPSIMPATELASIIKRLVHTDANYSIATVDGAVSTQTQTFSCIQPEKFFFLCYGF